MERNNVNVPRVESLYRTSKVHLPDCMERASGIIIQGRKIRSLVFSTDIAIIRNCNADAVLAVYPFSPQQVIMKAIMNNSNIPVFCGIGGGFTGGLRSALMAKDAEALGAIGVVVNMPFDAGTIRAIKKVIDIPIVGTVVHDSRKVDDFLEAGVSILNVSAAQDTPSVIRQIRAKYPSVPIMATGGHTKDTIMRTIEAGANAITYTPPSTGELFRDIMTNYRNSEEL